jgi:hypothetical protein
VRPSNGRPVTGLMARFGTIVDRGLRSFSLRAGSTGRIGIGSTNGLTGGLDRAVEVISSRRRPLSLSRKPVLVIAPIFMRSRRVSPDLTASWRSWNARNARLSGLGPNL